MMAIIPPLVEVRCELFEGWRPPPETFRLRGGGLGMVQFGLPARLVTLDEGDLVVTYLLAGKFFARTVHKGEDENEDVD